LIEVGEHIVTEKKLGFPSTYREIFEILKNEGIISGEVFNSAKRLIFLRNLIAHEYYRIREEELLEMVELLESANNLIQKVKKTEL
ncbi:MAG: HepT-like ribonuclease domain-containing protein, partial [Candidatus Jordarchaeaceae archaeon]